MKGWGPKSSVCHSKPRETKLLGGIYRDFCRDIQGVFEKFEEKKFVFYHLSFFFGGGGWGCKASIPDMIGRGTEQVQTGRANPDHLSGYFRGRLRGHLRGTFCGSFRGKLFKRLEDRNLFELRNYHVFLSRVQQTVSGNKPSQHPPDTIRWTLFRCALSW